MEITYIYVTYYTMSYPISTHIMFIIRAVYDEQLKLLLRKMLAK